MKRKYTHYAAALTLAAGLALSPMANAEKSIQLCGTSITVGWWSYHACSLAVGGIVAGCSAPVDGGVTCGTSITAASLACGISVPALYGIIKNCF